MELMKVTILLGLIISFCKGFAWIAIGTVLVRHLESFITLVTRREVPEIMPDTGRNNMALPILKLIGVLIIIIGITTLVVGSVSFIAGFSAGGQNFNLKF